jgi:hypothetical protein
MLADRPPAATLDHPLWGNPRETQQSVAYVSYPRRIGWGGTMIGVEISRLRDGFLVTDAGGARREAGMLGGERTFVRIAGDVARRYGVRFDQNMIFDIEVADDEGCGSRYFRCKRGQVSSGNDCFTSCGH